MTTPTIQTINIHISNIQDSTVAVVLPLTPPVPPQAPSPPPAKRSLVLAHLLVAAAIALAAGAIVGMAAHSALKGVEIGSALFTALSGAIRPEPR